MFGDRENGFPYRVYSFLLIISWLLEPHQDNKDH